jgi:hypothetical protein
VTNSKLTVLLSFAGLFSVLVLAGLPVSRVAAISRISDNSGSRQAALEKLYDQLKSGAPFSEEEALILGQFGKGYPLSDLEADVLISRSLYDYYVAGSELTKEQETLLSRFAQYVTRRDHDIADWKSQLLNRRIAAAAVAPPRNTPLAPPPNDLCSGAEVIPGAGPFPHLTAVIADITDATGTGDPPAPSCQTNLSRTIWYRFTPSVTADYTISSCADGPTATTVEDTVMAIYTSTGGCAGPFTELPTGGVTDGCDDDSCAREAFQAVIGTRLTAGTEYFIVISQFGSVAPLPGKTAVQLRIARVLGPANEVCATASPLLLNTPVNGTTIAAGADYSLSGTTCFSGSGIGNSSSTAGGGDVVYSFTAPAVGSYSFRVTNYDTFANLVLYVSTSCPAPGVLTCNSASGPVIAAANRGSLSTSEEVKCVSLGMGQQVFVFVDENLATVGGSFTIEATTCQSESEPNDTPATASLFVNGIEGSINPAGDADFYSIGAPAAGSRIFALVDGVAASADGDFDLRVTSTTDTLEYDHFNNDAAFGSLAPNVAGTLATGTQTFLRVNHFSANPAPPGPPITPEAAEPYRLYAVVQPPIGAAALEVEPNDTIEQANSGANYFSGSLAGPAPSTDEDIFAFPALSGDLVFLSLDSDPLRNNTPMNGALELLDSSGAVLLSVNDSDSTSLTTPSPGTLTGVTPASPAEGLVYRVRSTATYYVRVLIGNSSPGTGGDYLLSIAVQSSQTCVATLVPEMSTISAAAGQRSVNVNAEAGCAWNAVSNAPWITIDSGSSGIGNGTVSYSVAANNGITARTGTVTIAGEIFTLTQFGVRAEADLDADLRSEIGFYRNGTWGFLQSSQNYDFCCGLFFGWGGAGLPPIVRDFDGDGKGDLAYIVPPSGGQSQAYSILRSTTNYDVMQPLFVPAGFPELGDTPVVGDFDGDGKVDPGIWRSPQGVWIIPKSSSNYTTYLFSQWGQAGDTPIVADFDGDGRADLGFYRNGLWGFLQSSLDYDFCCGQFFSWGGVGLQPVVGDFDGDGKADIAYIVPPSGGQSATYAILKSSANYDFNEALFVPAGFPALGDTPVVGDFDGDRKDDPGIWRSSQGVWIIPRSTTNYATFIFSQWGVTGDIPIPSSLTQR